MWYVIDVGNACVGMAPLTNMKFVNGYVTGMWYVIHVVAVASSLCFVSLISGR